MLAKLALGLCLTKSQDTRLSYLINGSLQPQTLKGVSEIACKKGGLLKHFCRFGPFQPAERLLNVELWVWTTNGQSAVGYQNCRQLVHHKASQVELVALHPSRLFEEMELRFGSKIQSTFGRTGRSRLVSVSYVNLIASTAKAYYGVFQSHNTQTFICLQVRCLCHLMSFAMLMSLLRTKSYRKIYRLHQCNAWVSSMNIPRHVHVLPTFHFS